MNRVTKLLRTPLFVISTIVLAVFVGILVLTSIQPHGNFYSYHLDMFFMQIGATYGFVDEQNVIITMYLNNEVQSEEKSLYKIENGNLYLYGKSFEEKAVLEGKINAYTIELAPEEGEDSSDDTTLTMTISVECRENINRKTLCIIMISISAFGLATSIFFIALNKRRYKIAKQKAIELSQSAEQPIQTQPAPVQPAPAQPECPYCDSKLVGNEEVCPVCHAKLKE